MSIQILSAKSTRRLARQLGDPTITRAWVNNGNDHHLILFATWDHIHGWLDRRTGAWDYEDEADPHFTSCYGLGLVPLPELPPFEDDGRWPIQGYDR